MSGKNRDPRAKGCSQGRMMYSQLADREPESRGWKPEPSWKCPKCVYGVDEPSAPRRVGCGYILIEGKARGCDPGDACVKYRPGKKKVSRKMGDGNLIINMIYELKDERNDEI